MSNLKDTDIDDLFRRASDKYPLRTDRADWDKMAAALDQDPAPAGFDGTGADDKRRKRRFFWLLLFLPLGGAGYYTWFHTGGHGSSHPAITVLAAPGSRPADGQENVSQKAGQGNPITPSATRTGVDASPASANGQRDAALKGSVNAKGGPGEAGDRTGASQLGMRSARPGAGGVPSGMVSGDPGPGGNRMEMQSGNARIAGNRFASARVGEKMLAGGVAAEETGQIGKDDLSRGATQPYIAAQPFSLEWAGDVGRARIAGDYHLSVVVTAPSPVRNKEPEKTKKQKTSYLYAGILAAPDFSTVKMQSIKGVGMTFGVLLGYAFNPRWSIETGAYVETKKYYTDGEYFKRTLPYGAQLLNVNGTCYMWEIPVNVRYIFNPEAKTKWFATAGLSTYLMTKEKYTFATENRYGQYGQSNWNNPKPSQYPFSIVNLSGGFEQSLGRVGNLRVEPYVRLPLQGLGSGKLPIMSTGLNIGITRRLW